jgi:hypothetical protein
MKHRGAGVGLRMKDEFIKQRSYITKPKMIFRKILTLSVLLFFTLFCFSQSDSLTSRNKVSSDISIAYNSSLIYPGLRLGIEFPVYTVILMKSNSTNNVTEVIKDRFVSVKTGWYHHTDFHDNLYFTTEWVMRRTRKSGYFTEFSSGLGYSRTFLGGTTYDVDNNGDVNKVKSAGYNYAVILAGAGLGINFSESKRIPLSVFYKFDMLTMFPYNSTIYLRPVMELGLIYMPESFLKVVAKKRIVKK